MRRITYKKAAAVAMAAALSAALLVGCGSTAASTDSAAASTVAGESTAESTAEDAEKTADEGDADEVAAKNCADLIDAIYVQERSADTDAQCEAAKAAWDALTDTQKELVEGENADPDYFGRDTGDASKDDARNADEIGENELLVVSFGTSYNDSRRLTIGAIENAMEEAFPEYAVRRGFTSQIIIDHVKNRDNVSIDNVKQALDRAVENGVKTLVIQPTHLMDGLEYHELVDEVAQYSDAFEHLAIGKPLLTSEADFQAVEQAITEATAEYDDGKTAICFMGHGTEAASNAVYETLQEQLTQSGHENYYIGTVEAEPSLDTVLSAVQKGTYERVILVPLMIVAGDHANNDMAGEEADSWKSTFEAAGYQVECLLNGLGEMESIQKILVEHAQDAIDSLHS